MSDSVEITLSNSAWTDISQTAANGLITNESNHPILIQESSVLPDPSDVTGTTVFPGPDGFYNWAGITNEIYARAVPAAPAPIKVSVTGA